MHWKDTWARKIPTQKLSAYKTLLDDGVIRSPHVTYSRSKGTTIVEYESDLNHDEIIKRLKEAS